MLERASARWPGRAAWTAATAPPVPAPDRVPATAAQPRIETAGRQGPPHGSAKAALGRPKD